MSEARDLVSRTLGRTGIQVPGLGMGCWPIGGPDTNLSVPMGWSTADDVESAAGLRLAYSLGVRLFDTADVYGHGKSERLIGGLVAEVPRDGLVLTSKVGYFAGTAAHGYEPIHMRHQLEQTLHNLSTDYLDIYFLHHPDFGIDDRWLAGAVDAMRGFREQGLVRAIGIRGPHRYAPERINGTAGSRPDKFARFERLFLHVEPDVLAVRDNLLTPAERTQGVLALATRYRCGVLFNKPLGQGLLTATSLTEAFRSFGPGDHRLRKRWFTSDARAVIAAGLREVQQAVGDDPEALISLALWSCLDRYVDSAVLAGFTTAGQVAQNVNAVRVRPQGDHLQAARRIMSRVQQQLDAGGSIFTDEQVTKP